MRKTFYGNYYFKKFLFKLSKRTGLIFRFAAFKDKHALTDLKNRRRSINILRLILKEHRKYAPGLDRCASH